MWRRCSRQGPCGRGGGPGAGAGTGAEREGTGGCGCRLPRAGPRRRRPPEQSVAVAVSDLVTVCSRPPGIALCLARRGFSVCAQSRAVPGKASGAVCVPSPAAPGRPPGGGGTDAPCSWLRAADCLRWRAPRGAGGSGRKHKRPIMAAQCHDGQEEVLFGGPGRKDGPPRRVPPMECVAFAAEPRAQQTEAAGRAMAKERSD